MRRANRIARRDRVANDRETDERGKITVGTRTAVASRSFDCRGSPARRRPPHGAGHAARRGQKKRLYTLIGERSPGRKCSRARGEQSESLAWLAKRAATQPRSPPFSFDCAPLLLPRLATLAPSLYFFLSLSVGFSSRSRVARMRKRDGCRERRKRREKLESRRRRVRLDAVGRGRGGTVDTEANA